MWGPGSGSEDQSLGSRTFVVFVPAGPAHPLSQKGGAGGGPRGCPAPRWDVGPVSRLLISSGFQAPGGSAGHPFQGAVAPAPGRGLQEMACGAGRAEVLWGLAWSWRGCRAGGPGGRAGGGANAGATPLPPYPWRLGSLGRRGSPSRVPPRERFSCGWKARRVREAPRERAPPVGAPRGIFLVGSPKVRWGGGEGGGYRGFKRSGAPRALGDLGVAEGGAGTEHRSPPLPTPRPEARWLICI